LENGRHPTGTGYVYLKGGLKHREHGPAEIRRDGYEVWWLRGVKHRVGGPAVKYPNGREEYWVGGVLLRVVDPTKPEPGLKVNLQGKGRRR
jgi:hypothetical protein